MKAKDRERERKFHDEGPKAEEEYFLMKAKDRGRKYHGTEVEIPW